LSRLGRRALQTLPVLLGAITLTFLIVNVLPGNVAGTILGENASPEAIADLETQLGLDRPLLAQYGTYMGHLLHGDLGQSLRTGDAVLGIVLDRLWISLQLMVFAQIFALILAIGLAAWSIRRPGGAVERISGLLASTAISVPTFLLGIVLILTFAVHWKIFPAVGFTPISEGIGAYLRTIVLPSVTLGFVEFAIYFRVLQSEMHEISKAEYITTAESKGLARSQIVGRHVLRNSLFPLITVVGLNVGRLLGGSVIVESVFAIPGMGRLLVDSIANRDMAIVQGVVLFVAIGYVLVNLAVDLLYSVLDPRLRHDANR